MDKEIYKTGEKIHVHVACVNFDKNWTEKAIESKDRCIPELDIKNRFGFDVKLEQESDNGNGTFSQCMLSGGSGYEFYRDIKTEKGVVVAYGFDVDNRTCINFGPFHDAEKDGFFVGKPGHYSISAEWNGAFSVTQRFVIE